MISPPTRRVTSFVKPLTLTLIFFFALITAMTAKANPISQYKWKNRIIVLDFPAGAKSSLKALETEIRNTKTKWQDRDIKIFHVGELGHFGKSYATSLTDSERADLRKRLKLDAAGSRSKPSMILIGKDGGTKSTQRGPFSLKKFYALIDTMPMRQREMRGGR